MIATLPWHKPPLLPSHTLSCFSHPGNKPQAGCFAAFLVSTVPYFVMHYIIIAPFWPVPVMIKKIKKFPKHVYDSLGGKKRRKHVGNK